MSSNNDSVKEIPRICMSQNAMHALFEMRTSNTLCDATITLADETILNVHRNILSSCSEYFRLELYLFEFNHFNANVTHLFDFSAVFTTTLNQNNKDVYIPGISSTTMSKVVDYAYLRRCEITDDNVLELMVVSDYVSMLGLMKLCIEFCISTLNPMNCIKRMLFARFVDYT